MTLRPHEVFVEIIDRIETLNNEVYDEIMSENPRGFACSAALRHLRGIVLSIDKLDSKYDKSIGLVPIKSGQELDIGDEEDNVEDTEIDLSDDEAEEEEPFRPFFGNKSLLIKPLKAGDPIFLIKPIKQVLVGSTN